MKTYVDQAIGVRDVNFTNNLSLRDAKVTTAINIDEMKE